MTHVLLNALLPIFAVMALGYLAGWVRDIDNHHVAELNALRARGHTVGPSRSPVEIGQVVRMNQGRRRNGQSIA